ncbi:MAG: InlB B-repeat-containing protein [Defluviitaleaceae bacterium]|nr:InlB B-repeat-containing protein [Defluviitaleaceae bacterium]
MKTKTKRYMAMGAVLFAAVIGVAVAQIFPSLFRSDAQSVVIDTVLPIHSVEISESDVPIHEDIQEEIQPTEPSNETDNTENYTETDFLPHTEIHEAVQPLIRRENQTAPTFVNSVENETNENEISAPHANTDEISILSAEAEQETKIVIEIEDEESDEEEKEETAISLSDSGVIINQMYAGGDTGNNAVSHSFVELVNPTGERVFLGDSSVQIQTPGDPGSGGEAPPPPIAWNVVRLNGYIEPHSSFLIVSTFSESTADEHRVIENWDIAVNYELGNRGLSVALVAHQEPLPGFITEDCGVIDLLGALNSGPPRDRTDNYLIAPARISRSQGVRRIDFVNTQNNEEDFPSVRYLDLSDDVWQEIRPRYSGDGEWAFPPDRTPRILPDLFINQIHGQGSPGTNAISHGFIEIYNPTNDRINLRGFSLQVANGTGVRPWNVLELPNFTMQPQTSFLVVSTDWFNDNTRDPRIPDVAQDRGHKVRYVIPKWDMEWDLRFNNSNIVVALVDGNTPLSDEITEKEWVRVMDLVGAHNNSAEDAAHYLGSGPAGNISRQASVRRSSIRNTRDNRRDFVRVHYAYPNNDYVNRTPDVNTNRDGITNRHLEIFRPRYSGDGSWNHVFLPVNFITINSAGTNHSADPNPAELGEIVRLDAGTPSEGQAFLRWTTSSPGVQIQNATNPTAATFIMPNERVTVTAIFYTPVTYGVNLIGGGENHRASPNPAPEGAVVTLNAGVAPTGTRFAYWESDDVIITNATQQFSATFTMPAENVSVIAKWEEIPNEIGALDVSLMELTMTSNNAEAIGNQFNATDGLFRSVSNLTAWSENVQRNIGYRGTFRTPIVLNNFGAGWRSVNPAASAVHLDHGITVDTATAFQIRFETTGHENIRFSARQRSTGSGPDFFALAYRVGSDGGFTSVAGTRNTVSLQNTAGFRDNAYSDLNWSHSQTFNNFRLPPEVENESVIYIRVYMRESEMESSNNTRTSGNTSINDIKIIGDEISGFVVETFDVTIIGGGENHSASPNPATEGANVILNAGTAPIGMRFVNWTSDDVDITNPTQQNGASITMPASNVTVTANWEAIPFGTDILLMELVQTENTAIADNNQFNATDGIFGSVSNLTAWSGNIQRSIGYLGTERTPIVFNNFEPGWRSVNPTADAGYLDHGITVDTATAFQIRFETTGHENIRFSARQRSTGSGPDFFALAYRIGSNGDFTSIPNTRTTNRQSPLAYRGNAYSDFNWTDSQTFDRFRLPAEIANEEVVYLRVYMRESTLANDALARVQGNTSINNIRIIGDELGAMIETFDTIIIGGGTNHSANPNPAQAGETVTLNAGVAPTGTRFGSWFSDDVAISNATQQNGATFLMPAANVTVTANWEVIQVETDVVLMAMSRLESNLVFADNGNQINATGGLFRDISNLQAFSDNQQVLIGSLDANNPLAPVAFRNQSNVGGRGWRGIGTMAEDAGITIDTASAWQIRFSTEGFENIRFSAQQRSTTSGPDGFALAYRVGETGSFIPITGSERNIFRGGAGDATVFNNAATNTFANFILPVDVENKSVVYLRVYANNLTITDRPNGNTSINNIVIMGDATSGTTATIIFDTDYVEINGENLTQTINVNGTAMGEIILNYSSLPEGFFATTSGAAITVTGIPPAPDEPPVAGTFTIYVTRGDVTKPLEIRVNLPPATMPLKELLYGGTLLTLIGLFGKLKATKGE